jgi:hypothetical protein
MKPTLLLKGLGVVVYAFAASACSGEITDGSDSVSARPPALAATVGAQTDPAVALSRAGRLSWFVNLWRNRSQPIPAAEPLPYVEPPATQGPVAAQSPAGGGSSAPSALAPGAPVPPTPEPSTPEPTATAPEPTAPEPTAPEAPEPEASAPRGRKGAQRRREHAAPDPMPEPIAQPAPEPTLPLLPDGETDQRPGWADLVRALNFPRDDRDREGFRALKSALRHHGLAQMLQAAEDVLTILSQQGVYTDDLEPAERDAGAWRRFIAGARGSEVDAVGAIRDPRALEAARGLMKSDPIFRDTALFFHRRLDAVLAEFASEAPDERLLELADTRSGRAFMLLARVNGAFG